MVDLKMHKSCFKHQYNNNSLFGERMIARNQLIDIARWRLVGFFILKLERLD